MTYQKKYIHLTDTDIDSILGNFISILNIIDTKEQEQYLYGFHDIDIISKKYDKDKLKTFINTVIKFLQKKNNRLRIKTDLKLNKTHILESIYKYNNDIKYNNIKYWIELLIEFVNAKQEIYDHIDEMKDTYKEMYDDYIDNYDKSLITSTN